MVYLENREVVCSRGEFSGAVTGAVEQDIFGREQKEKLLTSAQTVYCLRDNDRKEMDAAVSVEGF